MIFSHKNQERSLVTPSLFSENLAQLKRKKQREYSKNRKSEKWKNMDNNYRLKVDVAKRTYYKKEIASLTNSDPRKWYHWLKRLVPSGQLKGNEFSVEDINHLSSEEQAEKLQMPCLK